MASVPILQLVENVPKIPDPVSYDIENPLDVDENEVFRNFLLHIQDIVKIALSCSVPSSYRGDEAFLLYPFNEADEPEKVPQHYINVNDSDEEETIQENVKQFFNIHHPELFTLETLKTRTGISIQALKSFPKPKLSQKISDILNAIKGALSNFNKFLTFWQTKIRPTKSLLFEVINPKFTRTKKLLSQIYHSFLFLGVWSGRYFIGVSFEQQKKKYHEVADAFISQIESLERTMGSYVDKEIQESEAERIFKTQFSEIYITWNDTMEHFNKLVGFGISLEPSDLQDKGFAIFPSQSEGYKLSRIFENKLRNLAWRVANFPWLGGSAVSESILRPDILAEVLKESHFDGKKFSKNLPAHLDPWRGIMMETLQELDFSKMTEIFSIIKNVQVDQEDLVYVFPEPTLVAARPNLKMLEQNNGPGGGFHNRIPITSTEIDSNSYENEDKSNSISSISAPSSIGVRTRMDIKEVDMESKLNRSIAMVREYLSRARLVENNNSKYSEEHRRNQLGKAIDLIDKVRLDYDNYGTPGQWDELVDLELQIKGEMKKNFDALAEIEVVNHNQHHLPRGILPFFEGESSDYHDFKDQICKILSRYQEENLKLSTLRNQIRGPQKASILEKFKHATTLQSAFEMLHPHFGNFSVILPKLKSQLMELPSNPVLRETESQNVSKLLNFLNLLQKHGKQHLVDDDFLYHFQHKLRESRMQELRDENINNFSDFKEFLLKIQSTNLNLSLTQSFGNLFNSVSGGSTSFRGGRPKSVKMNLSNSKSGEGSAQCKLCSQTDHRILDCPRLREETDMKKKIKMIIDSRLCISCLKDFNKKHKCSPYLKRFKCESHNCNITLCGCPVQSKEIHNNTSRSFGLGPAQELDRSLTGQDLELDKSQYGQDQELDNSQFSSLPSPRLNAKSNVNEVEIGAIGFLCETIPIIDKNGKVWKELIAYDTYASHSTIDEKIVKRVNFDCINLGTKIKTYTYNGNKVEYGRKASLKIQGIRGVISMDFLVSNECRSVLSPVTFDVPQELTQKYNLESYRSHCGTSYTICGMDRPEYHPKILEISDGVIIAESRITGNIILAGRGRFLRKSDHAKVTANRSVSFYHKEEEADLDETVISQKDKSEVTCDLQLEANGHVRDQVEAEEPGGNTNIDQVCDDSCMLHKIYASSGFSASHLNFSQNSETQYMKNNSSDSVQVSPIRHCPSCKNCPQCSRLSLQKPMNEEIVALEEIIRESVKWDGKERRFVVSYPHNELLRELPDNEEMSLKIMKNLERKLVRSPDLLSQFNEAFERMTNEGVFVPVSQVEGLEKLQKSYICLTYSLGKTDLNGKNKLRLCCNSSLGRISFNDTCPTSPPYLEKLQALLCRWRTYNHFAYTDITQCYTQCLVSLSDANLRRVYFRQGGLGGTGSWIPYISARVVFGDTLGGNCVSQAISMALSNKLEADVCKEISSSTMMDDVGIPGKTEEQLQSRKTAVEEALVSHNLPIKSFTTSGHKDPPIKYLSYNYFPETDTFSVRLRVNLSDVKRGKRQVADIVDSEAVEDHVEQFPFTRRRLVSLTMMYHDPLSILQPLQNNFKLILRKVIAAGTEWDEKLDKKTSEKLTSAARLMLSARNLTFPRQVLYPDSVKTSFHVFCDSSLDSAGVVIMVLSQFDDGTSKYQVLKTHAKLLSRDILNIPRGELFSVLIGTRLLNLLRFDLNDFLKNYAGTVDFKIISDSEICLNQLKKKYYIFKTWFASRLFEIQSLVKDFEQPVSFFHCKSAENFADALTREWTKAAELIPWINNPTVPESLTLFQSYKNDISDSNLPEVNKSKIIRNNATVQSSTDSFCDTEVTIADVLNFALANDQSQLVEDIDTESDGEQDDSGHEEAEGSTSAATETVSDDGSDGIVDGPEYDLCEMIQKMLERRSRFHVVINSLARIFMLFGKNRYSWQDCRKKAEMTIFKCQQSRVLKKLETFKGNNFYKERINDVFFVRGRNTIYGETRLFLIPPDTTLRNRIMESYHRRNHSKTVYLRGELLRDIYYLTSAIPSLRKISSHCPHCRKRNPRPLTTEMGSLSIERLTPRHFLSETVADLAGPYYVKEYVNVRAPARKLFLFVMIDEYSRYVILHPLQSQSTKDLLDCLQYITHRYGHVRRIRSDFGGNFVGARNQMRNGETDTNEDDFMSENEFREFSQEARSLFNTEFIPHVSHSPWITGAAEKMVSLVKKCLQKMKFTTSLYQWFINLEKIQNYLNSRPISVSNNIDFLCPEDLNSLKSRIKAETIEEFLQHADENVKLFHEKWKSLYFDMLFTQKKWTTSSKILENSLVIILDLVNSFGFPSLGKVIEIENDKDGKPRIYVVQHKTKTQQTRNLRRTAHSLSLILEGEDIIEIEEPLENNVTNESFGSAVEEDVTQDVQTSQLNGTPVVNNPEVLDNVAVPGVDLQNAEDDPGVDDVELEYPDNPAPVLDMILPDTPPVRVIAPVDVPLIKDRKKTRGAKRQQ